MKVGAHGPCPAERQPTALGAQKSEGWGKVQEKILLFGPLGGLGLARQEKEATEAVFGDLR